MTRSGSTYTAPRDANRVPVLMGVSTADGITPVALEVNPGTGQLQVSGSGGGSTQITDGTNIANVLKSDGTAAGQNAQLIAGTYLSTTWSVTTPQAVLATDVGNYKWASVHITSYSSGTVGFQGSNDNVNWTAINLSQEGVSNAATSTSAGSASLWTGPLNFRYFRLNITGAGSTNSGTVVFATSGGALATQGVAASQSGSWNVGLLPITTNNGTQSRVKAAASTNATSLKASAGNVYSYALYNNTATAKFVKFYNKASAPTVGTDTPAFTVILPANGQAIVNDPTGIPFATGIAYAITGAVGDTDTTATAVDDVHGYVRWM